MGAKLSVPVPEVLSKPPPPPPSPVPPAKRRRQTVNEIIELWALDLNKRMGNRQSKETA